MKPSKQQAACRAGGAYYGMKLQRNNLTRCCFHDDHHPSMKLNDTYCYCLACFEHCDVIDLIAHLH